MTDARLRKIYDAGRKAVYAHADPIEGLHSAKLGRVLDLVIEHGDRRQAGMMDWAIDNGFPEFDIVLRFGNS